MSGTRARIFAAGPTVRGCTRAASSSATLPVTIAAASDNLGVKKSVAGSVLPLGATINMDGTALYLGILALFTAQAFGYDLTLMNYVMIAFTAAIVSISPSGAQKRKSPSSSKSKTPIQFEFHLGGHFTIFS